jgi:hypothetical protein
MIYTKKKGACKWFTPPQRNRTKKQEGSHKTSEAGIEVEVSEPSGENDLQDGELKDWSDETSE